MKIKQIVLKTVLYKTDNPGGQSYEYETFCNVLYHNEDQENLYIQLDSEEGKSEVIRIPKHNIAYMVYAVDKEDMFCKSIRKITS